MSILEVKNVSIRYMTGDFKDIGLKEYIMRNLKGDYHINEFWADKDICFALEKGDMLGIIGSNGAGKSTLLKVISGIMEPTKGWVKREGTIAALLELGSGFDGDLTVRENAYLRGAMLGYTRKFMDEAYHRIIEFAELQDFQDRPFKQLSSGMKSRLAFSIASLVEPDILILDEVLSVGDGAFRKKSEDKMEEIISGGATTILVSHSLEQVRRLCNKVLWLHKGEQIEFGNDVEGICDRYQTFLSEGILPEKFKNTNKSLVLETHTGNQMTDTLEKPITTMEYAPFSKGDSFAIKGIAILMMMWHHCFLKGRFEQYTINFWPLAQSQIINVAAFFKICVSLFAFVSGYGLWMTYRKVREGRQSTANWVYEKMIKTLSNFWFVVILAWIICTLIDRLPYHAYEFEKSSVLGIWNMFMEFFGLTNLTGAPQLNSTWWYMSAAVVFIILFPFFDLSFEKVGCFCTIGALFIFPRIWGEYPGGVHFLSFLRAFVLGMAFARQNLFVAWRRMWRWANHPGLVIAKCGILLLIVGVIYKVYYFLSTAKWWDVKYGLIPVVVILASYELLQHLTIVRKILMFLGKHATNIFLVHTFIRYYYCGNFIYTRGHFLAIIGCLFLFSLGISIVIEYLKEAVSWQKLIDRLLGVAVQDCSK